MSTRKSQTSLPPVRPGEPTRPSQTSVPSGEPARPSQTGLPSVRPPGEPMRPSQAGLPSVRLGEPARPSQTGLPSVRSGEPARPSQTGLPSVRSGEPARSSQTGLPSVRSGEPARPAQTGMRSEEGALLSRLLEAQAELAALADKGEVEEVMRLIATRGQELSGAAGAALGVLEDGEILFRASTGSLLRAVGERPRMASASSMGGQMAQARQILRSDDTELDARVDRAMCRKLGARSLLVAPLLCGERLCAVLFVLSPRPSAFGEAEERRVALLARVAGPPLAHAESARSALGREQELRVIKEMLRRRDAELEVALQAMDAAAYVVAEGGTVRANRSALELLGENSALALKGHPAALAERLLPRLPETQARVGLEEDPLAQALRGQPSTRELVVRHVRHGTDVLVRSAALPVRVDGAVVGAVVVQTDVEARRQTGAQAEQFLALVERSSECMAMTSFTGRPVYLNPAGRALLGFESQEAFRASPVLDMYLPEDREAARLAFTEVREQGHWEGKLRLREPRTGAAIPVWHQLFTLVAKETGRPVALGSVIRDLRESQREEEVRERLMDIIGNDLRTPLSAIAVGASTLLRRGALSEVDTKAAVRIAQSAERMGRLVGQVLDFTRAYLGAGLVLLRTRVDLDVVAQDVVAAAELEHPDRLVRYAKRGDSRGLWDRERLSELLSTLVRHALLASPVEKAVDVRLRAEGEEVLLEVHRAGAPIPPEVLPRLFDAFRPPIADDAGHEHEGLGLFSTRAIARAHGGEVEVRSSAAEGTTFRVRLPRGPSAER
ncbi:ATP-binding protein [Hyalangium rubrum]|uniref:histidine kinase n=1 Tax=Hyalangium rubrum TaxID=3103134 RepID=A0ABU5HDB9_9BACT|nr:ATP-binding protein [Hyalangium sp. s54d21]MDY7231270.1 ATP-binding protein [Hyalangium sp. s54d21]